MSKGGKIVQLQQISGRAQVSSASAAVTLLVVSMNLAAVVFFFLLFSLRPFQQPTVRSHLIARNHQNVKMVLHSCFVLHDILRILPLKDTMLCFQGRKGEANKEIIPLLKPFL